MEQLQYMPTSKENGLVAFQKRGWILIDATYEPVNRLSEKEADKIIVRDYPLLRDDLANLLSDRSAPVALLKANVCRLLDPLLTQDGFSVLNKGRAIYFPGTGRQRDFRRQFCAILKLANLELATSSNS